MRFAAISKLALVMTLMSLFSVQSFALSDEERQAISDRVKPVGTVCIEGGEGCGDAQAAAPVAAAAPAASSGAKSGEDVYNAKCSACHGTGAAGAPILGNKDQWSKRIAAGNDALYDHALKGFNAMPAKGMCMDCSDDEIKAAVDYMVSKSK